MRQVTGDELITELLACLLTVLACIYIANAHHRCTAIAVVCRFPEDETEEDVARTSAYVQVTSYVHVTN